MKRLIKVFNQNADEIIELCNDVYLQTEVKMLKKWVNDIPDIGLIRQVSTRIFEILEIELDRIMKK